MRAAAVLTTGFVDSDIILGPTKYDPALRNQVNLLVAFTKGSLTSLDIKPQYSIDGVTWYDETFESISGAAAAMVNGLYNFTADGNYVISLPIKTPYFKFQARGNGTVTSSSLKVDAILGTV